MELETCLCIHAGAYLIIDCFFLVGVYSLLKTLLENVLKKTEKKKKEEPQPPRSLFLPRSPANPAGQLTPLGPAAAAQLCRAGALISLSLFFFHRLLDPLFSSR